jgi:hypothetical protein
MLVSAQSGYTFLGSKYHQPIRSVARNTALCSRRLCALHCENALTLTVICYRVTSLDRPTHHDAVFGGRREHTMVPGSPDSQENPQVNSSFSSSIRALSRNEAAGQAGTVGGFRNDSSRRQAAAVKAVVGPNSQGVFCRKLQLNGLEGNA